MTNITRSKYTIFRSKNITCSHWYSSWTLFDSLASEEVSKEFVPPDGADALAEATLAYLNQVSRLAHIVETKLA
jgi:hypothetical protein